METLFTALTPNAQNERVKYCVFSHFDAGQRVERYVLYYLQSLKACGYEIVLVSTAPSLSGDDLICLKDVCNTVCLRENVGYDFGSFKAGIGLLKQHGAKVERLLVANDSVFGPFNNLQPLLRSMERQDIDLYGLTDSHDHGYHLQSYFISYSARVYDSPVFDKFWSSVDLISSSTDNFKQKIVHNYEVGGSQHFIDAGCTYAVAFPYRDVLERMFRHTLDRLERSREPTSDLVIQPGELVYNLNASHCYWDELIDMGLPFIKRELLTKNPTATDVSNWPQKIAGVSGYDVSMILEALIHQNAIDNVYPIDTANALEQIEAPTDTFEVAINPALAQWINGNTVKASLRFRFDDDFYLQSYPDIAAVVAAGDYPFGLGHFKRYGFPEGRKCAFKLAETA
jgi:lipopolysaccharide biosynthesis protein